jgi:hypothetical protein
MVTFLANPDVQQAFDVLVGNIGALDDRAELSVFARPLRRKPPYQTPGRIDPRPSAS